MSCYFLRGKKISFSDVGKIIYYLSHLILTFAQNAVYTIMALQGKGCRSMYPPLGALGGIIQSVFTICLET